MFYHLYSNFINLTGKKLIENVVFKDISLTGLWDQVNIDELNAGAIRLDGNQVSIRR